MDTGYSIGPFNSSISERVRNLRVEYVPSRKRFKPAAIDSVDAMVQRIGDAPPSLILGNCPKGGPRNKPIWAAAGQFSTPCRAGCVSFNFQHPVCTKRERHRAIQRIEHLSGGIRALQIELARSTPLLEAARKLHILLTHYLVTELEHDDASLPTDLVAGMPIVGLSRQTSSLPEGVASAVLAIPDVGGAAVQIAESRTKAETMVPVDRRISPVLDIRTIPGNG